MSDSRPVQRAWSGLSIASPPSYSPTASPLQDVQDAMGARRSAHDRAHDRARHSLDRHPTYVMAP